MVCANIDASKVPKLQRLFQPSVVLTVGGAEDSSDWILSLTSQPTPPFCPSRAVSITDVTPNTTFLSFPGPNLVFNDEVAAISAEVRRLQSQGVNKFIALGHSGIKADITIAKQVPGLDLVVGGHSNTFLYEGTPPEDDKKYGEYPLGIPSEVESGRFVLVVQDYAFGKYLGYLKLKFNDAGEVTEFDGNPILLNSSVSQGQFYLLRIITGEDVLTVVPFMNTIDVIVISGEALYQVFEHSVAELPDSAAGQFLQVSAYSFPILYFSSGFVVTYDLSKPVGERVVRLAARCSECKVPQYQPVEKQKRYKLLINSYIADGGDGYTMIKDNTFSRDQIGYLDSDLLFAYLKDASPITTGLERRITFVDGTAAGSSSSLSAAFFVLLMSPILSIFTALVE
ncbi:5'-nucleotidase-like [Branchiostoma lanceolatum]|uniref:5'-nucleotidase-like n=1 Tax=Branchiostoma lanceolatum TaxID=7740 RepID=UPI00345299D9